MLILLDTANFEAITRMYDLFPYDGVTTNPTILKNEKNDPMKQLLRIREFLPAGSALHAQVISETAEEMVEEAHYMVKRLGEGLYVKVPVSAQGLKAISILSKEGIHVTATAIYTPMQAFMAAKAGAKFTAPYVNRIDNMGADGVKAAMDIHDMLRMHKLDSEVLAASFKNSQQILELCRHGIGSVTAAPDVLEALIKHPATDHAITAFNNDFAEAFGKNKTMLELQGI
ncbi:transaldolase family protein [Paenibacillus zanthoxyli]|uniref:transaldolase family protein n=1 Tax=Paenibacillus zanthoxyli TaxID=369399 RepID=UPI000471A12D|nr:transaldolase family protein [Paenibacillus zanthoxyli]